MIAPPDSGDIDSVAQVKEKQISMHQGENISNFRHCSSLSAPACMRSRLFLQYALYSVTLTVNTIQRSFSAVAVPVCSSDASITKISIYSFDIDISNRVVSAASISIFFHISSRPIFTALHVMQTRYCDEISVRLSVCPSVRLSVTCVYCDKTEERSVQIFIPYERIFILVF